MDPRWIYIPIIVVIALICICAIFWCCRRRSYKKDPTTNIEAGRPSKYELQPYIIETRTNRSSDQFQDGVEDAFSNRHVVRSDRMPNNVNGWNSLMHQRGLSDRDRNTFIVDKDYDEDVFTQETRSGNFKSNRRLEVVDLKRNKSTGRYGVAFRGQATVQVKLDDNMRPVHFQQIYKYWRRILCSADGFVNLLAKKIKSIGTTTKYRKLRQYTYVDTIQCIPKFMDAVCGCCHLIPTSINFNTLSLRLSYVANSYVGTPVSPVPINWRIQGSAPS